MNIFFYIDKKLTRLADKARHLSSTPLIDVLCPEKLS